MADYIMYWRRETAAELERGAPIPHAGSNQFFKLKPGDTVWTISSDENGLFLLGRIPVAKVIDRKEAQERLEAPWDADWHIVATPPGRTAPERVDFQELAPKLEFDGRVRTVTGKPSHHHFRSMRKLTSASSALLKTVWDHHTER